MGPRTQIFKSSTGEFNIQSYFTSLEWVALKKFSHYDCNGIEEHDVSKVYQSPSVFITIIYNDTNEKINVTSLLLPVKTRNFHLLKTTKTWTKL